MGIAENWLSYVTTTKSKADSHAKAAEYWDTITTVFTLTLIVLSALTTISTLLPVLTNVYITTVLAAITTIVSAIAGTVAPSNRRQRHTVSSNNFKALMLKMLRVETDRQYVELWKEYNKEMVAEPFLPPSYAVQDDTYFSMTPEFTVVMTQKEGKIGGMMDELDGPKPEETQAESKSLQEI